MLNTLADPVFPITQAQFNPVMEGVCQLNILDAGLNEKMQRALGIHLHIFDLWVKSKGKIDYRGLGGHNRLMQDAMTFCGTGNPVATRHGDLAAAHLAIDFHDTQRRLQGENWPLLSRDVNELISQCADLGEYPPETEKRVGLYMDFLGKKKA